MKMPPKKSARKPEGEEASHDGDENDPENDDPNMFDASVTTIAQDVFIQLSEKMIESLEKSNAAFRESVTEQVTSISRQMSELSTSLSKDKVEEEEEERPENQRSEKTNLWRKSLSVRVHSRRSLCK